MSDNSKRRKIMAVLAGGLVLGVGAAITLAAWNDSEFATGTFTAGDFDLQGSTTSGTAGFSNHDTAGTAAGLSFTLPAGLVTAMAPGETAYAPFWVRLAAGTTSDATLAAASITPGTGGNEANFSHSVSVIGIADVCDANATGTVIASGANLSTSTPGTSAALTKGTQITDDGTAIQLCFAVTSADQATLLPGTPATATWEFEATSTN